MKHSGIIITAVLLLCAGESFSQTTVTMKRLPDTGQTGDYTNTPGEDSDFRINTQFFIVNGNGTVTDTVTTLIWQQNDGGEMTWEQAQKYCDTLTLGGYNDWRLPQSHELFSIHDFSANNPALNTGIFGKTVAEYWWSSETLVSDATRVWATNAGGGIGPHPKTETVSAGGSKRFHVRAVRNPSTPPTIPAHFSDNNNETVTDNITGLLWQQYCLEDSLTWEQALGAADTLRTGGFTDWRLPNIKEIQSLNSETRTAPSVELLYFPCVGAKDKVWSSTTLLGQGFTNAWMLQADVGIISYQPKSTRLKVLCVRGGTQQTTDVEQQSSFIGSNFYPNPVHNLLYFTTVQADVRLFSLYGKEILTAKECSLLDVSMLPAGIYVLQTGSAALPSVKTFMKY